MVAQGTRKEFTLHSSLPPDTDFRPVIQNLIGFPCDFEIRHVDSVAASSSGGRALP